MTRRRARRPTQRMSPIKSLSIGNKPDKVSLGDEPTTFVISNNTYWNRANNAISVTGGETTIHPNYAFRDTAVNEGTRNLILAGQTTTQGYYTKMIVLGAKLRFRFSNLDSVAKIVTILPVAFDSAGLFGDDYAVNLANKPGAISILLAKQNAAGESKELEVDLDCSKIEGISVDNPFFLATSSTRGTRYSKFYIQYESLDATTVQVNGCLTWMTGYYTCKGVGCNKYLNV